MYFVVTEILGRKTIALRTKCKQTAEEFNSHVSAYVSRYVVYRSVWSNGAV